MVLPIALPLVPLPASAVAVEGRMPLTGAARVHGADPAAAVLIDAIAQRTGLQLTAATGPVSDGDVVLRTDSSVAASEGYVLAVGSHAEIIGADPAGVFYGVQTLLQLLGEDESGWSVQCVEIADAPRFAYRGIMLDVARHFFSVADVKAYIDRASALKYNHLHLHLTDDQGWRVQIDSWPLLTEKAATSSANGDPGGFYTKADYREIVDYAASRHMVLVPEIDLPGHTHAIGVAYPEIVEAPVMNDALIHQAKALGQPLPAASEVYTGWGVGHSSVRIREEGTYEFVRDVLTELAEMTPGPYLHIGGDESLGTKQEDFDYFVERVSEMVVAIGKTPMAWHEVGAAKNIAEGTIGQYWGNTVPSGAHGEEGAHFHTRGGKIVMSASNVAYLDMKYDDDFPFGLNWAGLIPVRTAYEWEPTAVLNVPDDAILGLEAPLWSETVATLDQVDQLVFPRAAAHAEIAWSAKDAPEREWESFRARLGALAPLWRAQGINFYEAPGVDWSE